MRSVESVVVWSSMSIVTIVPAERAASQIRRALSSAIGLVERLTDGGELHRHLGAAGETLCLEPRC